MQRMVPFLHAQITILQPMAPKLETMVVELDINTQDGYRFKKQ
jgi:hypothetical protein